PSAQFGQIMEELEKLGPEFTTIKQHIDMSLSAPMADAAEWAMTDEALKDTRRGLGMWDAPDDWLIQAGKLRGAPGPAEAVSASMLLNERLYKLNQNATPENEQHRKRLKKDIRTLSRDILGSPVALESSTLGGALELARDWQTIARGQGNPVGVGLDQQRVAMQPAGQELIERMVNLLETQVAIQADMAESSAVAAGAAIETAGNTSPQPVDPSSAQASANAIRGR
ncbi:unnamed protein product, partial [marine sediment metagenome]